MMWIKTDISMDYLYHVYRIFSIVKSQMKYSFLLNISLTHVHVMYQACNLCDSLRDNPFSLCLRLTKAVDVFATYMNVFGTITLYIKKLIGRVGLKQNGSLGQSASASLSTACS